MKYENKSKFEGQEITSAKMCKEGVVKYIDPNTREMLECENDPNKRQRLVVAHLVEGVPVTPRTKFGVVVYAGNAWRLIKPRWPTLAAAKAAAEAIACVVDSQKAAAVVVNWEVEKIDNPEEAIEEDTEELDRDREESGYSYYHREPIYVEPDYTIPGYN